MFLARTETLVAIFYITFRVIQRVGLSGCFRSNASRANVPATSSTLS